jgi:hypothetical protein
MSDARASVTIPANRIISPSGSLAVDPALRWSESQRDDAKDMPAPFDSRRAPLGVTPAAGGVNAAVHSDRQGGLVLPGRRGRDRASARATPPRQLGAPRLRARRRRRRLLRAARPAPGDPAPDLRLDADKLLVDPHAKAVHGLRRAHPPRRGQPPEARTVVQGQRQRRVLPARAAPNCCSVSSQWRRTRPSISGDASAARSPSPRKTSTTSRSRCCTLVMWSCRCA